MRMIENNIDRIWEKIKDYKYISFDIFDTLVKRNISSPKDVFDIVSNHSKSIITMDEGLLDFPFKRIQAEKKARKDKSGTEITLQDIYNEINIELEDKNYLMKCEIETEYQVCVPNFLIKRLYDRCINSGKRVLITSDMYLPECVISKILQQCGYKNYYKLYLSSSVGKQKATGELFLHILNDLKIKGSELVHIGDNKKADVLAPFQKGIKAIYVKRQNINTNFVDKKQIYDEMHSPFVLVNNMIEKYKYNSEVFRWGYEAYGPLIYGFCKWVNKVAHENDVQHIFFLARDMYLIKDIYKEMFPDDSISYLEISRKSLRKLYVLKKKNLNAIFDTMARKKYTLKEICNSLDIDIDYIIRKCEKETIYIKDKDIFSEEEIPCFKQIEKIFLEVLKEKKDYAEEYLRREGLLESKKTAIVDIGWHGTIQNMLEKITLQKYVGIYFGSTKRKDFADMTLYGYWYETTDENSILAKLTMISILEVMLFPKKGTTLAYEEKGGLIVPIYASCETSDKYSIISDFQMGARQFVKDFIEKSPYASECILSNVAVAAYEKLAFSPTFHQAKVLSQIPYEEGQIYKIVEIHNIAYYLLHPRNLIHDYKISKWKTGFIKQLFPWIRNPQVIDTKIKERKKQYK